MAALDQVDFSKASILSDQSFIRELVGEAFWRWFRVSGDIKVTTIRVWIIRRDIYVKDLEFLFELLFGPPPK